MNSINFKGSIGTAVLAGSFLFGTGMISCGTALAQRPYGQDQNRRDRDDGRNRDDRYRRGGPGNVYQMAQDRGYQDGLGTGANDARNRQNYNPQRSHYYRNATDGYDRSYGNKDAYRQAYRDGFTRGYEEGFRRNGGRNRRPRNGRWFPF